MAGDSRAQQVNDDAFVAGSSAAPTRCRAGRRAATDGHRFAEFTRRIFPGQPPSDMGSSSVTGGTLRFAASSPTPIRQTLADQFAAAWGRGDVASADEFIAQHPAACRDPEIAVQLIYEEFCLRQEAGEDVGPDEILKRFPQWRSQLQLVLDCHQLVQTAHQTVVFPEVGEELGEFRLLAELGRGAQGRVYLATQPSLSDRPVVVKVIRSTGLEHLSLARLQHASIVPLYFVQDLPDRRLRLLCMPYVGGITLTKLLERLADVPVARRSGLQIVEVLRLAQRQVPFAPPVAGPALQFLPAASFVQAACWITACLAEALQYAHGRGLVHLDVKPSNILLAGDGQPMLLDFHLAYETHSVPCGDQAGIGGTPGFMAPEQQRAMEAMRQGATVAGRLDGRADIYALGVVLHLLLGGERPGGETPLQPPGLRACGAGVPRRVVTILRRCLAPAPSDRYPDAGHLAADLRRCLVNLPGVAEQAGKRMSWKTAISSLGERDTTPGRRVALLATATLLASAVFAYQAATVGRQGPAHRPPGAMVREQLAERRRLADDLHTFVQRLRYVDSLEEHSDECLGRFEKGCQLIWRQRSRLLRPSTAILPPAIEDRIRTDLLDLVVLAANLRVRLASPDRLPVARREALALLTAAEAELGPSSVWGPERAACAAQQVGGGAADGEAGDRRYPGPRTVWEHVAVGRCLLHSGRYDQAAREFQEALERDPQAYWPNFYAGVCAYRLGQFDVALVHFSTIIAIAPGQAAGYANRAQAFRALGHGELADCDLARAGARIERKN